MDEFYIGLAFVLLVTIVLGLARILSGPSRVDRMLAAQLFGTTGVAVLLLLAQGLDQPALRDVALVFALLATVTVVAFIQRVRIQPEQNQENRDVP